MPDSALEQEAYAESWPDASSVGQKALGRHRFGLFRELPVLIVVALTMALLIKTFLIQAFYIPSESMVPTLLVQDRVLVNKLAYRFRDPARGEIVVFITGALERQKRGGVKIIVDNVLESLGLRTPKDVDFIKRVIGLPGDTLEIKNNPKTNMNAVYITPKGGKTFILDEPYIRAQADLDPFGPFTVPEGRYFLMGDNRRFSSDSRSNNFTGICPSAPCAVPKSRLVGKAFIRLFPFKRLHTFDIPAYASGFGLATAGFVRRRRRRAYP